MSAMFLDAYRSVRSALNDISALPEFKRRPESEESLTENPSCFLLNPTEEPTYSDNDPKRLIVTGSHGYLLAVLFRKSGSDEDAVEDLIADAQLIKDALRTLTLTRPGFSASVPPGEGNIEYVSPFNSVWDFVTMRIEIKGYNFFS